MSVLFSPFCKTEEKTVGIDRLEEAYKVRIKVTTTLSASSNLSLQSVFQVKTAGLQFCRMGQTVHSEGRIHVFFDVSSLLFYE